MMANWKPPTPKYEHSVAQIHSSPAPLDFKEPDEPLPEDLKESELLPEPLESKDPLEADGVVVTACRKRAELCTSFIAGWGLAEEFSATNVPAKTRRTAPKKKPTQASLEDFPLSLAMMPAMIGRAHV